MQKAESKDFDGAAKEAWQVMFDAAEPAIILHKSGEFFICLSCELDQLRQAGDFGFDVLGSQHPKAGIVRYPVPGVATAQPQRRPESCRSGWRAKHN